MTTVKTITARLRKAGAEFPSEKAIETSLTVLGLSSPGIRSVLKALAGEPKLDDPALLKLAIGLVETQIFEARQVAYELLGRRRSLLATTNAATLERLGAGNDNWRSVDIFGPQVAGVAWRLGGIAGPVVTGWAGLDDPWWRRTALTATLGLNQKARGGKGDAKRSLPVFTLLVDDTSPTVRKALSWGLRELIPHDSAAVEGFINKYETRLPAAVAREVRRALESEKG